MIARITVTVQCPACGRCGVIDAPEIVRRLTSGHRPRQFRCDRRHGGCGLFVTGEAAALIISWDTDATPFSASAGGAEGSGDKNG